MGLLGTASIRRRRLFQKSKQKKMKSCVTSEQKDILKPCGVKLLTEDVNYDLLSLSFNKRCFFQVNFLINAAFENAAFIREWCLFHISLLKYGVYWRAAFIRGRFLKEEIR